MKSTTNLFPALAAVLLAGAAGPLLPSARAADDTNTVALWLFDETQYSYTPLSDAGPSGCDLRLETSGRLGTGRFGNALLMLSGSGFHAYYSEWDGEVGVKYMRGVDGEPSGLWGPTIAPGKLLAALAGSEWTCEFWLKLLATPSAEVAVIHLGNAYDPGLALNLTAGATAFRLTNAYGGFFAVCTNSPGLLTDGQWHHVAFAVQTNTATVRHYLDGQLQTPAGWTVIAKQSVPPTVYPPSLASTNGGYGAFDNSKNYSRFRTNRFNLSLGEDRKGLLDLSGLLDELRFSSVARYTTNFPLPGSFSRNYGTNALPQSVASGPVLLFPTNPPAGPVALGSRRHLFIDGALLDTTNQVSWVLNPPTIQGMDANNTFGGDYAAVDHDGKVQLVVPDGYSSSEGIVRLWTSVNGTNFTSPNLGLYDHNGTTNNNIILYRTPMWGRAFKDLNPNIRPDEQFKLSAWVANAGIILYTSPDLIHWRRNETIMLPLVSGGGAETYWDDQNGWYQLFIKRDSSFRTTDCPLVEGVGYRVSVGFQTRNVTRVWPFTPMNAPWYEAYAMPCVTCEGPIVFGRNNFGQVYRTRAIKYEWAPDVYLAFLWRLDDTASELRQTELMVSRDGQNWKSRGLYLSAGQVVNGVSTFDALVQQGLIRRGSQLWHYGEFSTAPHGGGSTLCARLVQRFDGFVSLDATSSPGVAVTRPLIFAGNELTLNLKSESGVVRVGILNEAGDPLPGFAVGDCDPLTVDSVEQIVSWRGVRSVSSLAGSPVRLRFELQNAKLYAMQFGQRSLVVPWLEDVRQEDATVRFSFNAASNQNYAVEFRSADAINNAWLVLTNLAAQATADRKDIVDPLTDTNRLYRVRAW